MNSQEYLLTIIYSYFIHKVDKITLNLSLISSYCGSSSVTVATTCLPLVLIG